MKHRSGLRNETRWLGKKSYDVLVGAARDRPRARRDAPLQDMLLLRR
jgi:hypothetical protein